MLEACYENYFSANDNRKTYIAEGIFWLADIIEEEVRAKNPANRDYCIASICEIKQIAEKSFKDPQFWVGTEEFSTATHRLLIGLQA